MAKRALVTGGAGLIGSHVVDLLVNDGWEVRALDNLEPQTHRRGKPAWINKKAEFVQGDLRDRDTIAAALDKIDVVFHQAAYGGYMPEISKVCACEFVRHCADARSDPREKPCRLRRSSLRARRLFTAKGPAIVRNMALVFPAVRPVEQLRNGDWQVHCPNLRRDHDECADAGKCAGRWRNRLRPNES